MTYAPLVARAEKAGLKIGTRQAQTDPVPYIQLEYVASDGTLAHVFWNHVKRPDAYSEAESLLHSLRMVGSWIPYDERLGQGLLYAVHGEYVVSLSFPRKKGADAARAFDGVVSDLDVDIRGDSENGPDPARNGKESRVAWHAKKLRDITDAELAYRLMAAGAKVQVDTLDPAHWTVWMTRDGQKGTLHLFDFQQGRSKDLTRLASSKQRRCAATDPDTEVMVFGAPALVNATFLEEALAGLSSDIACN